MKYFSIENGCFYLTETSAPGESIQVSDEEHLVLINRDPTSTLAVVDGKIVVVPEDEAAKLSRAKGQAASRVRIVADRDENAPVQIGPYLMRGGSGSAMDLKGQLDLQVAIAQRLPELGITTVKFYDVAGEEIEVPIESETEVDAWDIVIAVAQQVSTTRFKQIGLERAIAKAMSKADLDAITWES